jgi:hypothetical protein
MYLGFNILDFGDKSFHEMGRFEVINRKHNSQQSRFQYLLLSWLITDIIGVKNAFTFIATSLATANELPEPEKYVDFHVIHTHLPPVKDYQLYRMLFSY